MPRLLTRVGFGAVLVAIALCPPAARAQSGWLRNGKPVTGEPNLGTDGPLAVIQVSTTDANGLIAAWPKPTPATLMKGAGTISSRRLVTTFLIFKGCTPDPAGACNVTADFEVVDPHGLTAAQRMVPVRVGEKPGRDDGLVLSATGFGLTLNANNAVGAYHIRATTTDHVASRSVRTEQILILQGK